jgi:two-component system, OmpR family, phosphate regulon sensor histidine kinase PhoR
VSWALGLCVAWALVASGLAGLGWWRQRQLLRWTSTSLGQTEAPPLPGATGEIARRVERALRQAEARCAEQTGRLESFLSAIDASPNGILLLDAHDHLQWINQTASAHFGLDVQRDRLQPITNLVRAPAFVAYLQSGPLDESVRFASPRGETMLSVTARPYGNAMKLVLSQDITARERSDRMRRDFVANVSHEIRSPLTVLAGFIETLADLPLTGAERQRVLVLMRQQTDRMRNLVTDLLALAQIEGAPRPLSDTWTDVGELMAQLEVSARATDRDQHRFALQPGQPAQMGGIESELFSAFWNLVSNALRYTPPGGSVTVQWNVRPDGTGEFRVTDTGPGIEREHIPRLTERFYRVDGSRSRETGGTGLGLAIVKHVVQRHDGELLIDSVVGKGSVFRVVLPAFRVRSRTPLAARVRPEPVN